MRIDIKDVIDNLTLEQKCAFICGENLWSASALDVDDVLPIKFAYAQSGIGDHCLSNAEASMSLSAVLFPSAYALGCTWDPEAAFEVGKEVANDACKLDIDVLVVSGPNPSRSLASARSAFVYSEDPQLNIQLCASFINGISSSGIGVVIASLGIEDREEARSFFNYIVDKRNFIENYFTPLYKVAMQTKPMGILIAAGNLNGVNQISNPWIQEGKDILEKNGFDGMFLSPWFSGTSPVLSVENGCLPEMTLLAKSSSQRLQDACSSGMLSETLIDSIVAQLLECNNKLVDLRPLQMQSDISEDAHIKRAKESIILLENNNNCLPAPKGSKINLFGCSEFDACLQTEGRNKVQGAPLGSIESQFANFSEINQEGLEGRSDYSFVFANALMNQGQKDIFPSYGGQLGQLLEKAAQCADKVVLVLRSPSPVPLAWHEGVDAVVYDPCSGQGGDAAIAQLCFGEGDFTGKLSKTMPVESENFPSHHYLGLGQSQARYQESIYSAYKYSYTAGVSPRYWFGHGLSYASFEYSGMSVSPVGDSANIEASIRVTNNSQIHSAQVVQLYICDMGKRVFKPDIELRRFAKIFLGPNESKIATFRLSKDDFMHFEAKKDAYAHYSSTYAISFAVSPDRIIHTETRVVLADSPFVPGVPASRVPTYAHPSSRAPIFPNIEFREFFTSPIDSSRQGYIEGMSLGSLEASLGGNGFDRLPYGNPKTEKTLEMLAKHFGEPYSGLEGYLPGALYYGMGSSDLVALAKSALPWRWRSIAKRADKLAGLYKDRLLQTD